MFYIEIIATLLVGILLGYFVAKNTIQKKLVLSKRDSEYIINEAKKEAKFVLVNKRWCNLNKDVCINKLDTVRH